MPVQPVHLSVEVSLMLSRPSVPTPALFSSLASETDTSEKYMKPSVAVIVMVDTATASHNVP